MIRSFFEKIFVAIVRGVLKLRYRAEVVGLENLHQCQTNPERGILFLPNHPAEMDPIILSALLFPRFRTHPLVVEHFYYLKGVGFFMKLVGALPLSHNSSTANKWKRAKYEETFQNIVDGLKQGQNYLVYPAGKLRTTDNEQIGGSSMVYNLVKAVPDTNIVLIRTTGLWGSRFSRALHGKLPKFGRELWEGIKIVLKNGIFFVPKRTVKIEIECAPKVLKAFSSRLDFNRFLESWYNKYPGKKEKLTLVSNAFWKKDLPQVTYSEEKIEKRTVDIGEKEKEQIKNFIATITKQTPDKILDKMHLSQDLGLDSLDVAQIYLFLDEKYHVENLAPGSLQTVEDVYAALSEAQEEDNHPIVQGKQFWPQEISRSNPFLPEGSTVGEAFLIAADRMGDYICAADSASGKFSYKRMKTAALILSEQIKKAHSDYVGILLPASVGVQLVVQACYLAKKIPVILNWTVGSKSLDHAVKITNLDMVITSRKFLEKLEDDNLGQVENLFVLMEDMKKNITLKDKLRALYYSYYSAKGIRRAFGLKTVNPNDPAVILFTSGTETLPKAVPLSHTNILTNQQSAMQCVRFHQNDIFLGTLPPFHSFGFTVTGLMCVLAGIKVYFFPNPTDAKGMAKEIAKSQASLLCLAPSFAKNLLKAAHKEELSSIRLCVLGAEKLSEELLQSLKTMMPQAEILEGYGITECSPVVTLCRPGEPLKGVGKPLPGIELVLIHPETEEKIQTTQDGEICIRGPSVFQGYLESSARSNPFIELDGKSWYRSGDMGHIDEDGTLILAGRLKRFVKIGGEMIGLTGLELLIESIAEKKGWKNHEEEGHAFALSAYEEQNEKTKLVLYTICDINRDELNEALRQEGIGRIARISEIKKIPEIPLTGTGKTHYRLLDQLYRQT